MATAKKKRKAKADLPHAIDRLYLLIDGARKPGARPSPTARLFKRGSAQIAKKLGEETVEAMIEGIRGDAPKLVAESADLLYHLIAMWAATDVRPQDVWQEIARREGFA